MVRVVKDDGFDVLTPARRCVTFVIMRLSRKSKASIADIAKICGVSKMTVSRAIRNRPNVSEATRQLVLRVAERENYIPSGYGSGKGDRRLTNKQYHVLFQKETSLQDVFFSEIIRTIQQELFGRGKNCSVSIIDDEYGEFLKLYDMLQTGNVAGIFVVGPFAPRCVNALLEKFCNVVLVDNPGGAELARPCSGVFCENSRGALSAVRHLLRLGRSRVLLISGPEDNYFSKSLIEGYGAALTEASIAVDDNMMLEGNFRMNGGWSSTKKALETGLRFDAVFSNDEMACGAIKALREAGMEIPRDVAVVGYDNLDIGRAVNPALTTMAVDREKMGRRAVELLLKMEKERHADVAAERIGLMPGLVVRESCGASGSESAESVLG